MSLGPIKSVSNFQGRLYLPIIRITEFNIELILKADLTFLEVHSVHNTIVNNSLEAHDYKEV